MARFPLAPSRRPTTAVILVFALAFFLGTPVMPLAIALASGGIAGWIPMSVPWRIAVRLLIVLAPIAYVVAFVGTVTITAVVLCAAVALVTFNQVERLRRDRKHVPRAA